MTMKQSLITAILTMSLAIFILAGCATNDSLQPDHYELLSLRSLPKGNELKDECTCLNEDINALNAFAKKMNDSRYAVHYYALSHQKISVIQDRADAIGCKYPTSQ